jgi:methionyl-tRNA synthetase
MLVTHCGSSKILFPVALSLLVYFTTSPSLSQYGVDQTRFFLMSEVNFGNDGDFSDKALVLKVNANLANELGNLCQRTLSLVHKNCAARVPAPGPLADADEALLEASRGLRDRTGSAIAVQAIQRYVEVLVQMIWDANKYIDEMAPWALKKTDPDRMATVLYVILEVVRRVAILYQPLIPASAGKILDQLGIPAGERAFEHLGDAHALRPGTAISKPHGVFPRLEMPAEELVEAK